MKLISKIYMSIIFLFLYAPIFVLIIFSFNNSKSRSVWTGFTFKWYKELFNNKEILNSLWNTLLIALISSILATILGTLAAVCIPGLKKNIKQGVMTLTNLPMMNPEIVTGVSLMILFVFLHNKLKIIQLGLTTLIFAHTTFCLPYVVLAVLPKMNQLDSSIYEAALDLGCNPFQALYKVVLPEIFPGIISGAMMSFTMSIDDFVISYFTSGTLQTLPITIYSMTRKLISPEINALSTLLFASILILLIISNISQKKIVKGVK